MSESQKFPKWHTITSLIVLATFLVTSLNISSVYAQLASPAGGDLVLPLPGTMVRLSPAFNPPILKGIKIHPDNPFKFDFVLDQGTSLDSRPALPAGRLKHSGMTQEQLKVESNKLIKYFLASLTVPEKDLWVNLSPYEKNRIVPDRFGQTEMGRDLLAQDYLLKQVTASLVYPERDIGKQFWKRVYEIAGNKNIPVSTFNKVWIVPNKAVVYENAKAGTAYVVESSLKVMTEQDYLATSKVLSSPKDNKLSFGGDKETSQIIHDLVIPQLTKEVNEGKNFAQLRQVYNSLILATWYKKKIQESILAQVYADKNKIKGTEYHQSIIQPPLTRGHVPGDAGALPVSPSTLPSKLTTEGESTPGKSPNDVELIYARYLQAFKKGAYNYIKEEQDSVSGQVIPKKYFSGGFALDKISMAMTVPTSNQLSSAIAEMVLTDHAMIVEAKIGAVLEGDRAMTTDKIQKSGSDGMTLDEKRSIISFITRIAETIDPPKHWNLSEVEDYLENRRFFLQ